MTREDLVGTWKFQGFTLTDRDGAVTQLWGERWAGHPGRSGVGAREVMPKDLLRTWKLAGF